VSSSQVSKLDHPAADVDPRPVGDGAGGRGDGDLGQLGSQFRHLLGDPVLRAFTSLVHRRGAPFVAPDLGWHEGCVAECMVEVVMAVHDDPRVRRDAADVVLELAGLPMRGTGVDDEHPAVAHHDPDVLVEELVPQREHAARDLVDGSRSHAWRVPPSGRGPA